MKFTGTSGEFYSQFVPNSSAECPDHGNSTSESCGKWAGMKGTQMKNHLDVPLEVRING